MCERHGRKRQTEKEQPGRWGNQSRGAGTSLKVQVEMPRFPLQGAGFDPPGSGAKIPHPTQSSQKETERKQISGCKGEIQEGRP